MAPSTGQTDVPRVLKFLLNRLRSVFAQRTEKPQGSSPGGVLMALLQVNAVSKSFGAIHALTDVSFSLDAGEVVGFMGDNGAGKSTMVKLIAGNFPPTDGEVV